MTKTVKFKLKRDYRNIGSAGETVEVSVLAPAYAVLMRQGEQIIKKEEKVAKPIKKKEEKLEEIKPELQE